MLVENCSHYAFFVVANMLSYVKLQLLKWNFVWTCKYFSLRLCKHVYKCAKSLTFWVVCINEYATFGLKSALRLTAYIKQKITSMKFHPSVPSLCLSVFPHFGFRFQMSLLYSSCNNRVLMLSPIQVCSKIGTWSLLYIYCSLYMLWILKTNIGKLVLTFV